MPSFTGDYFLLVLVAALGVLQVAAAYSKLNSLLFVRHRPAATLVGLALIVGAFVWFFASEPRNLPDTGGGIDANGQTGLFAAAAAAALVLTLLASSLLNHRMPNTHRPEGGLDALRTTTYGRALMASVQMWRRMWRQWKQKSSSG